MQPLLYEINTRCWLKELSERAGSRITLANVPERELSSWRDHGFTHIWLMGIWRSGPLARAKALADSSLRKAFSEALPGWSETDAEGSPYAIAAYEVPENLGGDQGLRRFRERLNQAGIRLILDFVGNHLGLDHPWLFERPGLFVQSAGPVQDFFEHPAVGGMRWFAFGKDPYFPAWSDTAQLDYRLEETQTAMAELLTRVAGVCDGVRCDMAMLMLSEVFGRTWRRFPPVGSGQMGGGEFWRSAIAKIKSRFPGFQFVAEAYWDLEERLANCGFDFVYEKELLDWIVSRNVSRIQSFLTNSNQSRLARGVHFLENHDEDRVAGRLSLAEQKAATVLILALPGMRFLHEGQLTGARVRTPVHLTSRPVEPLRDELQAFHTRVLSEVRQMEIGRGEFEILQPLPFTAGEIAPESVVAIRWQVSPGEAVIVAVNLASAAGRFRLQIVTADAPLSNPRLEFVYELRSGGDWVTNLGAGCLDLALPAHGWVMARVGAQV